MTAPRAPRIVLREMTPGDVAAVAAIEQVSGPDPWSEQLFHDEFASTVARHWAVATVDERIVGFGGTLRVTDELHVMNIAVDPDERRAGVGTRLLAHLLGEGVDRGAISATLEVRTGNEAAVALYRRFGFAVVGRRERYYPDGEDAVIMWVHRMHRPDYRSFLADEEQWRP